MDILAKTETVSKLVPIQKVPKPSPDDYLNKDVVELFTEDGERFAHFMGYGYYVEGDAEPEYRFLEYVHNTITIDEFADSTGECSSDDYNEQYNFAHHCYIEDCNAARLVEIYEKGFGGKRLRPITRATAKSLPDGFYLWDWIKERNSKKN